MKIVSTFDEIVAHLEATGELHMASVVRLQTQQLKACRETNASNLRQLYALREKLEPRTHYVPPNYRSPPESDG